MLCLASTLEEYEKPRDSCPSLSLQKTLRRLEVIYLQTLWVLAWKIDASHVHRNPLHNAHCSLSLGRRMDNPASTEADLTLGICRKCCLCCSSLDLLFKCCACDYILQVCWAFLHDGRKGFNVLLLAAVPITPSVNRTMENACICRYWGFFA